MSKEERSPSARGTETLQSCLCRPGRHSMTTGRRSARGSRDTNHETRITAFTYQARQASATKSWRSYRVLPPSGGVKCGLGPGASRACLGRKSCVCMAVVFAVDAQGSHHQKPPPGPRRPPASHGFPDHDCPLLPAIYRLSCRPVTASLTTIAVISRYCAHYPGILFAPGQGVHAKSAVLGRPHDERRWPQNEPMPRKGNVLDCVEITRI